VASDDKKQRYGGYDLAAGCEDFSTERRHGRGDCLPRGDVVNAKNSGCFLVGAGQESHGFSQSVYFSGLCIV
jgi:hypothetical protein